MGKVIKIVQYSVVHPKHILLNIGWADLHYILGDLDGPA